MSEKVLKANSKRSRRVLTLKLISLFIALTAVLVFVCDTEASTLEVGSGKPYITIQSAITVANPGDTVLVYYGIYKEHINFNGKTIMVKSANGPAYTIINGNASGTVVTFDHGEGSGSVLDGFTIKNGYGSYGGGIYCESSSPTITNCTITGNSATIYGGGICIRITSSPTITNCTITANTATLYGGGIACYSSSPIITNCTISGNAPTYNGGGISCENSSPTITNCTISGNPANYGGGIYCYSSSLTITNCTITGNSATLYGGGIFNYSSSTTKVQNSILCADTAPEGKEIYIYTGSTITVTYSDVEDGWTGTGNINADPLFVGNGDYHLKTGSPCIDSGTNVGAPTSDIDGDSRPQGAGYDMGSDEYLPLSFRITSITQAWSSDNDITITWESNPGLNYDVYLKNTFTGSFTKVATVNASGASASWTDDGTWPGGTHPTSVQQRYYKVSQNGTDSENIVGMYKIAAHEGMNLISLPLIPFSTALKDVIGTQVTGAGNEGAADRIWVWNGSNYEFAWLVEGTGSIYDGKWFTGNSETTITLGADQGAWLQIRPGHGSQDVYLLGEVSSTDREILLSVGMNLVGSCYPVSVPLGDQGANDSNLWESGATGATNEGGADRVWSWTGSNYQFHWLVEGAGQTYDGLWYTGNNASTLQLNPGEGYWVQIRAGHSGFTWVYPKLY